MEIWKHKLKNGAAHLAAHDSVLAELIEIYPSPSFAPHTNYYQELVESIIGQQLSIKAAATIVKRFVSLFGHFPGPEEILAADPDTLRTCGLSHAKIRYVQDLAQHIVDGAVKFDHLDTLTNEEIITELTAVKGIGEWTVHMFLIFCMGRLNVLATGDLGVRNAIKHKYELSSAPTPDEIRALATKNFWHPYESIACWYLWKSLDNAPKL